MITLTWNHRNALAGSCRTGEGLSAQGREFVRRAQKLGILLDVSHLSDRAFWDLCEISEKPIVASHSNSRAVCANARNLTDEQFGAICRLGGTAGLNLYRDFLSDKPAAFEDVYRHLDHFLSLGGEGHVALGGDLDGCDELPEGFSSVASYPALWRYLAGKGYSEQTLTSLFSGALLDVLRKCLYKRCRSHGLGRGLADGAELDVLKLVRGSSRSGGIGAGAARDERVDIAFDDAALGAGAGCQRGIDAGGDGLGHRSRGDGDHLGLGGGGSSSGGSGSSSGSFFGGRGGGRFGAGLQEFKRIAGIADGADVLQAGNLVALVIERGEQGAGRGGGALELRLVGLVGEEDIADRYRIADLLLPRAHDARFDSNAFLRHQYAFCHN